MAINIRKDGSLFLEGVVTAYNTLVDAALTTQSHRDKTSKQNGTAFVPSSTPLLIAGVTTDAYTCNALAIELKGVLSFHIADTSAHLIADIVDVNFDGYAVGNPASTNVTNSIALANAIKVDYSAHMTQTSVHLNNDVTNTIAAPDATEINSLKTLLADLKAKINLHDAASGLKQRYVLIPA